MVESGWRLSGRDVGERGKRRHFHAGAPTFSTRWRQSSLWRRGSTAGPSNQPADGEVCTPVPDLRMVGHTDMMLLTHCFAVIM